MTGIRDAAGRPLAAPLDVFSEVAFVRAAVQEIAARYEAATGLATTVFAGSSDGARRFGVEKLQASELFRDSSGW